MKGFFRKDEIKVKYKRKDVKSPDHLGYAIYMSDTDEQVDVSNTENLVLFTQKDVIDLEKIIFPEKGNVWLWITVLDKHHNETAPIGPLKFKVK
jgi:predicted membrane protein